MLVVSSSKTKSGFATEETPVEERLFSVVLFEGHLVGC